MEETGRGATFANMDTVAIPGNPITLLRVVGMLYMDALIYLLLALYKQAVFPGK